MAELTIQIKDTPVTDRLKMIINHTMDQTIPLKKSKQIMYADVMRHFQDQSGPDGAWAPWKVNKFGVPLVLMNRRKGKKKHGPKILMDQGNLRKVISQTQFSDNKMALVGVGGEPSKYAPTHQFGDPRRNIPQREFLWLSKKAQDEILLVFAEHNLGV